MYGPGQAMPPPKRTSPGVVITLRVLFTVLPIISLSLLGWASMLRLAWVRKRSLDWTVLVVEVGLSFLAFAFFGFSHSDNDKQANVGGTLLMICMFGTALYFLIEDIRRPQADHRQGWPAVAGYPQPNPYTTGAISGGPGPTPYPQQGYPARQQYARPTPPPVTGSTPPPSVPPIPPTTPTPQPGPRINQVRAELDELSDYLRKEEGR